MKNTIDWKEYLQLFETILNQESPKAPYDDPDFFDYLKLNNSRQNRWLKTAEINPELTQIIKGINQKQTWYLIVEPWCGDAAHSVPFIYLMTQLNDLIDFKVVLRDTEPFMIDDYLTNGGKSIPKLVVRDEQENDLFTWGPRPKESQDLYLNLKNNNTDLDAIKVELQKWYNKDKGEAIQQEFADLLK